MERAHRPAALRRAGPRGLPRLLGRALQGSRCTTRCTPWASRWRRSRRPSATGPATTATPCSPRCASGDDIEAVLARLPHQGGRARVRRRRRHRRGRGQRRPGPVPLQALLPRLRARHDHPDVVRRRRRPTSPTPATHRLRGRHQPDDRLEGKLVWKVDWPMRWAFEHVDFEPAGMDHATPGSSFTVGHGAGREHLRRCRGRPGSATGSSGSPASRRCRRRAGGVPTAEDALRVLEAPILRWLYVRRNPKQAFNIDFGAEVVRLYDEWDALGRKAADPAQARRPGAGLRAGRRRPSTAGVLPTPAGRRAVPAARPRSPTSPPARPS